MPLPLLLYMNVFVGAIHESPGICRYAPCLLVIP